MLIMEGGARGPVLGGKRRGGDVSSRWGCRAAGMKRVMVPTMSVGFGKSTDAERRQASQPVGLNDSCLPLPPPSSSVTVTQRVGKLPSGKVYWATSAAAHVESRLGALCPKPTITSASTQTMRTSNRSMKVRRDSIVYPCREPLPFLGASHRPLPAIDQTMCREARCQACSDGIAAFCRIGVALKT